MAGEAALRAACSRLLGALAFALATLAGLAGIPTHAECVEASDFIANAAHARDNGMHRAAFIERMQSDFATLRAFPPALRWFARDDADERFLLDAATAVFDHPRAPSQHRAAFLALCLARAA